MADIRWNPADDRWNASDGRSYRPGVVFGSDMKVRIEKANVFRYPDVSALCGPIDFFDEVEDAYGKPQLICEVLSASTRSLDRHEKFAECRLIDTYSEPDQAIVLESLGITLRLGDLYENSNFRRPAPKAGKFIEGLP